MEQAKARIEKQMKQILENDKDGDGKISKEEAPERLKRNFDRIDRNSDGFVDRKEIDELGKVLLRNLSRRNKQQNRRPRMPAVPDDVELKKDIAYRGLSESDSKKDQPKQNPEYWNLDLYLPKEKAEQPRAAIVFVHGGGWRSGDKAGGVWSAYPIHFAQKGYVCISINYRLSQVAPFPACVEDCKCAVRWLRANAKKYHIDPNKIGAYGNSAGAHLVSMLGLVQKKDELEGDGPYRNQSSSVQAVCPAATPSDFTVWAKQQLGGKDRLLEGAKESLDARAEKASPVSYARKDAPPFLIIHGTADRTVPVDQGKRLAEALTKAGAKHVTLKIYEAAGHGVFRQKEKETLPMLEKFFDKHLRADSVKENEND